MTPFSKKQATIIFPNKKQATIRGSKRLHDEVAKDAKKLATPFRKRVYAPLSGNEDYNKKRKAKEVDFIDLTKDEPDNKKRKAKEVDFIDVTKDEPDIIIDLTIKPRKKKVKAVEIIDLTNDNGIEVIDLTNDDGIEVIDLTGE